MPDSQELNQTANSTLAKLLEVDSELAIQEAELLSHLESVQEKRRSLKTVVSLFTEADTPATAPIESPAQTPSAQTSKAPKPVGEDLAAPPLETSSATATAQSQTEAPDTKSKEAKKTALSSTIKNKTTKFTRPPKTASGWQQYVREEFSNTSLPEAVSLVLQRQADKVFEIPAVVNAIFVDELPKEVGNKARRQVTNILSEGARKNKWYRGQIGYYSMSRAAAKANVS